MAIYLDNAASTPLLPEVKDWVVDHLDVVGNPSSIHSLGLECRKIIEDSRRSIANYMGCDPDDIIFTSGASQSNTLALTYGVDAIYESKIEHSSIREFFKGRGSDSGGCSVPVDYQGFVKADELAKYLRDNKSDNKLVVVQWANNEIGTIQDIALIADICHDEGAKLFVDATQIFPWINAMDLSKVVKKVDMLSASAHKCGGLKGSGILYRKPQVKLSPVVYGHQEQGLVGGTENLLGIGSFGEAVKHQPDFKTMLEIADSRDFLYHLLKETIPDTFLNGSDIAVTDRGYVRLPNNLNIDFGGCRNDVLVQLLDSNGIYCSGGSACNSSILEPSHVLTAIGLTKEQANSSVRFTFGSSVDKETIVLIAKRIRRITTMIRQSHQ